MTDLEIERLKQKWAALAILPETSHTLRSYLEAAVNRDPVDVVHKILVLAGTVDRK